MSYLRKPCLIPWEALETQFGADYGRPKFDTQPVLFVTLDRTREFNRVQSLKEMGASLLEAVERASRTG